MHRPVMSLAVFAAVAVTVSPVVANPLTGNERFSNRALTQESTPTLAPAKRVEPVRQIESIQRSDSAALLIPTVSGDNLRPIVRQHGRFDLKPRQDYYQQRREADSQQRDQARRPGCVEIRRNQSAARGLALERR